MKKILPLALAAVMLAGCGTANSLTGPRTVNGALSAQSKAGAEKGVRGMFKFVFHQVDADKNGYLTVEEMPAGVPATEPGAPPADPMPAKKAMLDKLDTNKNGRVTITEFANKESIAEVTTQFRREVGRLFANLDLNGDRLLVPTEMPNGPIPFEAADKNKNGKLTLSELEDGMAAVLAQGGGFGPTPVNPPAPQPDTPPAPPAEDPNTPPAPPADEPTDN
jgi:Ca2+-binding EF-hand superfamily protein